MTTYTLLTGDRAYSSWSLRGWLLFEKFSLPRVEVLTQMYSPQFQGDLTTFYPARTVPAVRFTDDLVISDSLAIAEELASRHPEAGLWPKDSRKRAIARHLAAEMHSSFHAIRGHCPMNLRIAYSDCAPTKAVKEDLQRLEQIWQWAKEEYTSDTPWLCGEYSVADVMFAPVAARIAGYNLSVNSLAQEYVRAHLADLAFRRWRAMALVQGVHQGVYDRDFPQMDFPAPAVLQATAVKSDRAAESINAYCPYSQKEVTDFLELDGRIYGFCHPFCRDKTAADPEAWPDFMQIVR